MLLRHLVCALMYPSHLNTPRHSLVLNDTVYACTDIFKHIYASGMLKGKGTFNLKNKWLKVDGFVDKVQNWWNENIVHRLPSYTLFFYSVGTLH